MTQVKNTYMMNTSTEVMAEEGTAWTEETTSHSSENQTLFVENSEQQAGNNFATRIANASDLSFGAIGEAFHCVFCYCKQFEYNNLVSGSSQVVNDICFGLHEISICV